MDSEYLLKISLTKHSYDTPVSPYYWSIVKYERDWHTIALGWEKDPESCFNSAMKWAMLHLLNFADGNSDSQGIT